MSRETKLSVLGALLDRVQKRAQAPRAPAPLPAKAGDSREAEPAPVVAKAAPAKAPEPARVEARPPIEAAPTVATLGEGDLISESVPPPREEVIEEGPPSAPRLREVPAEPAVDDAEIAGPEPDVEAPPPESGRQEVAQAADAESVDSLDMDIAITVFDSTPPPPPAPEPAVPPAAVVEAAPAPPPSGGVPGPTSDRLDLVPESGVIAPASAPTPAAEEVELAVSVPDQPVPAPEPVAASAPAAEASPSPPSSEPGLPALSTSPPAPAAPVRLMVAPPTPSGESLAPVEVWASTHAAPSLRGQVASFVGQNASFAPKSFGELVDASLGLGK